MSEASSGPESDKARALSQTAATQNSACFPVRISYSTKDRVTHVQQPCTWKPTPHAVHYEAEKHYCRQDLHRTLLNTESLMPVWPNKRTRSTA